MKGVYEKDIEETAETLIQDNKDNVREAIINGEDISDSDDLNQAIDETEFYYTPEDALAVLRDSDNVQEDKGLWEGQEPEQALVTQAVYTSQADLREAVEELYNQLKEDYETTLQAIDFDKPDPWMNDKDEDEVKAEVFKQVWEEWLDSLKAKPTEPGSVEEKDALQNWLHWNERIGHRGGYPLGSAYIDARCGSGYDCEGEQARYIQIDHETAALVPNMNGKQAKEVRAYVEKTFTQRPEVIHCPHCGPVVKCPDCRGKMKFIEQDKHFSFSAWRCDGCPRIIKQEAA